MLCETPITFHFLYSLTGQSVLTGGNVGFEKSKCKSQSPELRGADDWIRKKQRRKSASIHIVGKYYRFRGSAANTHTHTHILPPGRRKQEGDDRTIPRTAGLTPEKRKALPLEGEEQVPTGDSRNGDATEPREKDGGVQDG